MNINNGSIYRSLQAGDGRDGRDGRDVGFHHLETQLGFQHIPAGMILRKPWLNSTNGQVVHLGLEKLIAEKNPLMSADDQDRGHLEPGG